MRRRRSQEDYLEAILLLARQNGQVRSVDIAEYLNYSKPSVSNAMALLLKEGLIEIDGSKHITLTKAGSDLASKVYEKHTFFTKILEQAGVDKEAAAEEACMIEHAISNEAFDKMKKAFSGRPCDELGFCPKDQEGSVSS